MATPRIRRPLVAALALLLALILGACGGSGNDRKDATSDPDTTEEVDAATAPIDDPTTTTTAPNTGSTIVTIECTAYPAYDEAHEAVSTARSDYGDEDAMEQAEALVDAIDDPTIRDEADRALDLEQAYESAWQLDYHNDAERSYEVLALVEDPDIKATAGAALALRVQADQLYEQSPRPDSWHDSYDAAGAAQNDLYDRATTAQVNLYSLTTAHCTI